MLRGFLFDYLPCIYVLENLLISLCLYKSPSSFNVYFNSSSITPGFLSIHYSISANKKPMRSSDWPHNYQSSRRNLSSFKNPPKRLLKKKTSATHRPKKNQGCIPSSSNAGPGTSIGTGIVLANPFHPSLPSSSNTLPFSTWIPSSFAEEAALMLLLLRTTGSTTPHSQFRQLSFGAPGMVGSGVSFPHALSEQLAEPM